MDTSSPISLPEAFRHFGDARETFGWPDGDPGLAHTCSYDGLAAGTFPATRGFRCCADGDPPG